MDSVNLFDLNQLLKVFPEDAQDAEGYSSTLQYVDDTAFYIAVPMRKTVPLMLREGERVRIQLMSPAGLLVFSTKVIGWRKDAIPLIGLGIPTQFEKLERRSFVRLGILLEVLAAEPPEAGKEPVFQRAQALDISGGGIRLVWRKSLPAGTRLMVKFSLPAESRSEDYQLTSEVMRVIGTGHVGSVQLGLRFLDITTKQQDALIRFIFNRLTSVPRSHPLEPRR